MLLAHVPQCAATRCMHAGRGQHRVDTSGLLHVKVHPKTVMLTQVSSVGCMAYAPSHLYTAHNRRAGLLRPASNGHHQVQLPK